MTDLPPIRPSPAPDDLPPPLPRLTFPSTAGPAAGPYPPGGPYPPHPALLDPVRRRARRVGIIAAAVGAAGCLLTLALLLLTDLVPSACTGFANAPVLATTLLLLSGGGVVLYALLAIQGVRLAAGAGGGPTDGLAVRLRRARYAAGSLFTATLLVIGLGMIDAMPWTGLAGLVAVGCAAGCGFVAIDARRAAAEVDWARGVPPAGGRPRGPAPRAFEVLIPGQPGMAGPPGGSGAGAGAPSAHPAAGPAAEPAAAGWDWEWVLLGVVLFAVAYYVVRVPDLFVHLKQHVSPSGWGKLVEQAVRPPPPPPSPYSYAAAVSSAERPWAPLARALERAGGDVLALAWVAWGTVCLVAGPRLRRLAWGLALGGLGLFVFGLFVAAFRLPQRPVDLDQTAFASWSRPAPPPNPYGRTNFQPYGPGYAGGPRSGRPNAFLDAIQARLGIADRSVGRVQEEDLWQLFRSYGQHARTFQLLFPAVLLFLLTRPPVRAVFDRRRAAGGA